MEALSYLDTIHPLLKLPDIRRDLGFLAPIIIDCFENGIDQNVASAIREVGDVLKPYEKLTVKRTYRLYVLTNYFVPVFATFSLRPDEFKRIISKAEEVEGNVTNADKHYSKRDECILLCGFEWMNCHIHTIPLSFFCSLVAECASMNLIRFVPPHRLFYRETSDVIRILPFGRD